METKVIQICSASSSFAVKDYEKDIFRGWYARVAYELKKFKPNLDIECWAIEKNFRREKVRKYKEIKFRLFPTNLSVRHGMEISFDMSKALKEELQKAEKENKKLILHFHEYHSWLAYLILFFIKKNKKIKIIAQHHGGRSPFGNLKKYKRLFLFLPVIALMQFFENFLFKKVNVFYTLSDEEISYLKKITNSKIKFQTMGIGKEYFEKGNKEKAREELGLEKDKKYILYIGRIKTTKGIKELLDAMKISQNDKRIELLLIGEGPDFWKYKGYVKKKKIENVNFLGALYGSRKLEYLDASDCLILPSYTEGCPVVLMEAIAKNLPVIATNVGGILKMINNGREGLIIRTKSKEEIVKAIKEILTWKKDIRKYGEKYRWKNIIKETIKDYKN